MTAPYDCPDIKKLLNPGALQEQSAQQHTFGRMEESINAEARLRFFRNAVALRLAQLVVESGRFIEDGWLAALMREFRQGGN